MKQEEVFGVGLDHVEVGVFLLFDAVENCSLDFFLSLYKLADVEGLIEAGRVSFEGRHV